MSEIKDLIPFNKAIVIIYFLNELAKIFDPKQLYRFV